MYRSKTRFLFIRVLLIFRRVTTSIKKKKKEEKDQIDFKPIFRRDRSLRKIDSGGRGDEEEARIDEVDEMSDEDPTIARPKFRVNILGDYFPLTLSRELSIRIN